MEKLIERRLQTTGSDEWDTWAEFTKDAKQVHGIIQAVKQNLSKRSKDRPENNSHFHDFVARAQNITTTAHFVGSGRFQAVTWAFSNASTTGHSARLICSLSQ